jgi:hypothetical protein
VQARSLLPRRAPEGPAVLALDRSRLAQLERRVAELEAERDRLEADLALARAWARDLLAWVEHGRAPGRPYEPEPQAPLRRAATVTALVGAPWLLFGAGLAAGLALS